MLKRSRTPTGGGATDVEAFLTELEHPFKREILALRAIIREVDPAIRESIKWNAPSFSTTEHFATFQLRHQDGVQIVFHLGAKPRPDVQARTSIDDPQALLEWRGDDRALVSFRDLREIAARKSAFVKVVRQWVTLV
jgi:hypothetical protein